MQRQSQRSFLKLCEGYLALPSQPLLTVWTADLKSSEDADRINSMNIDLADAIDLFHV